MPTRSSGSVRVFYPAWTKASLVRHLRARLPALGRRLPLVRVVLFGSYARGRHTAASDIDLLVVYGGPPREDAYAIVRKALDTPRLEPHVYSLEEFEAHQETIQRMERNGIVLFER